jgi:hypothetical protein
LPTILRYETSLKRDLYKAIQTLQDLQRNGFSRMTMSIFLIPSFAALFSSSRNKAKIESRAAEVNATVASAASEFMSKARPGTRQITKQSH